MNEQELKQMKRRGILSTLSLLLQSSYSAVLGFSAFFILSLKSGTALMGIYSTVLASMSFFTHMTNLGLAAALIHKKDHTQKDLNSAFYIQMLLVLAAVLVGILFSNQIISSYKGVPPNTLYLYWSLLLSLFLLSLKTIPSVLVEKEVEIYKNVLVSSIENTVFYIVIIVMVFMNYTIEALIVGVLSRAVVGTVTMYILKPWAPTLSFSWKSAKELLWYGIPFQGNAFLALVKDDLMIIFLSQALGLSALGIISFGKKYAEMAVRIVTDNINRVTFPVFSKVRDNNELLSKRVMNAVFYSSLVVFPVVIGAMYIFDSVLKIVPGYYEKWQPALFSFYFFSLSTLLVSLTTPFINLFNATGKLTRSLLFMILWTALMWILIPLGITKFGYNIVSVIFFVVAMTVIFVISESRDLITFSIWKSLYGLFYASGAMIVYLQIVRVISLGYLQSTYLHLIFSIIGAPIIYITVVIASYGVQFIKDVGYSLKK